MMPANARHPDIETEQAVIVLVYCDQTKAYEKNPNADGGELSDKFSGALTDH